MTKIRLIAGALALAALASACGSSSSAQAGSSEVTAAEVGLPSKLLGLRLVEQDIAERLEVLDASYFDALSLFGFRENDEKETLRAALQVGRFNDLARPDDPSFVDRIIAQTGVSIPEEIRVGDHPVYMSTGQLQYTFLWFADDHMYVLNVRKDYPFSRSMLRKLLEGSLP